MKRNKGYTLVELIVAVAVLILVMAEVGSLMVNSQKLYTNGFYEVSLQENAQQIISQVQDMLMDAAVEVDFDMYTYVPVTGPSIVSDKLTIETVERTYDAGTGKPTGYTPVTYVVGRDVDLGLATAMKNDDGQHPGKEYCTLYLIKNGDTDNPIPVAEGVRAMHLDKFHYDKSDMVTIELEMQNKEYSYSAKSEVYLRNQIGTGGPTMPISSVTSGADVDLTVLRVHKYYLTDYVPAGYAYFKFKDSEAATLSTKYNLSGDELQCSSLATMWDATCTGTILASRDGSYGSDTLEIRIHTDAVNDGNKMPLYVWSNETADCLSVLPVTGICTCDDCVDEVVMDGEITVNVEGMDVNGHPVELPLNRNSNSGNFNVKTHEPEPGEHDMGSGLPTMMTKVGIWDNEIFQRSRTDEIDLTNCVFEWQPRYLKDMYRGTTYEGLDPFSFVPGSTSQYVYELCYDKCTEYLKWPAESGNWGGKYKRTSIHTDVTNGFALTTTTHTTDSQSYWDNIVAHGFGGGTGYVRVHLWCTFAPGGGVPDSMIYDTYAYMYPQMTGSDGQHGNLLDELLTMEPDPENPSHTDPYGAYYDHTPTY
ncbi:MAG: prepilin-type N-terminal cleavage/methylation domain-containing protein [Lachnospiraceae bacterium]|nr:prepilin-type N-terminal cleavage/methylation domain-containing protein [Lachnospiraceae bacterium]